MDKKRNRRGSKFESTSVDDIVTMSDDELVGRIGRLRSEIDRIRSRGDFSVQLETEHCYLQREYQVRTARIEAHRAYQQRCYDEDRNEFLREQHLPEYKPEPPPRCWWN